MSKSIYPINLIFGGGLSPDPGRKSFDFDPPSQVGVEWVARVRAQVGKGVEILAWWLEIWGKFPVDITPKRWEVDMWSLLDTDRKSYSGVQLPHCIWPWVTLKGHFKFIFQISKPMMCLKGAALGHFLLVNIHRKPYMGNLMASWHLASNGLERSNSRSFRFQNLISHKEA